MGGVQTTTFQSRTQSAIWGAVCWIVIVFVAMLVVETVVRIVFPWDLYLWAESPFLTNLMKLDHHLPVYSSPADGNSFVYSPGLEYLTFALLKPFGVELDIRYCRVISTLLGVAAAAFGALTITRLAKTLTPVAGKKLFFPVTWGVLWLVLAKNCMADIAHPDNLHALHSLAV